MKLSFTHVSAEIHCQFPSESFEITAPISPEGARFLEEEGCFLDEDLEIVRDLLGTEIAKRVQSGQLYINEVNWWTCETE